ncbi:MAG: FAD synthase [Methanobrevibacter sp.]|jgi:FAD synthetase|uniref:FAD synthase n=1 Tax=Methanobrevibacter sp. TaxID=66852 RepID=UPI0025D5517A|nr:FAD synthase [Methanobrevibacter sp.]MBR3114111.1 FAD synthase [Methanobrevibacter sp.]MBR6993124.1 FAD synthase [Methanobrevibacter sp.]MDO5831840.1 FAD synthase [Methanobrevibacter sp.]
MKKVMASGTFDLLHPGHGVYLEEAKNLGGYNSKLYVVVARDSTVEKRKRVPIVGENQRLELIKMLKPVDEAYLGNEEGDIFKIVKEIDPDIIAIGPDQTHNVEKLQKAIDDRGLKARVQRVKVYHKDELDSSCKIIKKIKNTDFEGKILDNCED